MSTNDKPQPLLQVRDLAVSFDNGKGPRIQAVDGVRMSVYPRQTLAVVGESGCGKSVTAMSALRLVPSPPGRVDRGEILFRRESGEQIDLLTADARTMRDLRGNDIAMIFQEPMTSLNPVFTVGEQIIEAVRLHQAMGKQEAEDVAVKAMDDVGIPDPASRLKAYPHQFSGGMRQRVMIAMALACKPRLLLADEPTTALDVTIQAQILDLLSELRRTHGLSIMLITHDLGVVAENADVVCVMYSGRVVEYASVHDVFEHRLHPYTRGLLASIPALGERRDRLVTISEYVDDVRQFEQVDGDPALRPWWPWHDAPDDAESGDGSAGDYALAEVRPGHWVGVWRTPGVGERAARSPDLTVGRDVETSESAGTLS